MEHGGAMTKKGKRRERGAKTTATEGPEDPLLGSRFQVTITSLVGAAAGEYSVSEHTTVNLVNLLREMRNHRDLALRHIWSCFLITREDSVKGIDETKDIIIEKIAAYWGVKVTRKQLEPKIDIEWSEFEDLKLPYDARKLSLIKKEHKKVEIKSTPEPSLEERLAAGKYDIE